MSLLRKKRSTIRAYSRIDRAEHFQFRPRLEALEDRMAPANLVVSTTADSGPGSLRQAITAANSESTGVMDAITFTVTGAIQLASALPDLSHSVNIQGPGSSALTIEPASGVSAGIFMIDSGVTANISGLTITKGSGFTGSGASPVPMVGGGIDNAGTLNLSDCVVTGNTVTGTPGMPSITPPFTGPGLGEGGGIYNTGSLMVSNCTVSNNTAVGGLGAGSTLAGQGGNAGLGGGIYTNGGSVTIVDSTVSGNLAQGGTAVGPHNPQGTGGDAQGGGLYITGAQVVIDNSTLSGNQALGGAGGNGSSPPSGTQTAGDGGNAFGGGVYVASGTLSVTSGTIADNSSAGGPAGTGGPNTVSFGSGSAGGIEIAGGTVRLADTILANTATTVAQDVEGPIQSNGYNLIRNTNGGIFTGNTSTDLAGVNPFLGPLKNNGGPTQTRALLAGSPAINAGDPNYIASGFNATDQRGLPRIVGGRVDIGAYEVQANEPPSGASIAGASASVVFVITADSGLAVHANGTWNVIGGPNTIASISAVTDVNGNATVFAVTLAQGLAEWSQTGGWQAVGGPGTIRLGSAGLDPKGLADVFVITTAGQLTEWSTSGGWLASPIGASGTILSMSAVDAGGVYALTTDHSVDFYSPQTGWVRLADAGFAQSISAAAIGPGQNGLYAVSTPAGRKTLYSYNPQTGWTLTGNDIQQISAGSTSPPGASGQSDVYVLTTGDAFATFSNSTGWQLIGAPGTIQDFSATTADTVFAVTTGESVVGYSNQTGWFSLSGPGFALG